MTTPDEDPRGPRQESRVPDAGRRERDFSDIGERAGATVPGLVVTEERLADGRAVTYFGRAR